MPIVQERFIDVLDEAEEFRLLAEAAIKMLSDVAYGKVPEKEIGMRVLYFLEHNKMPRGLMIEWERLHFKKTAKRNEQKRRKIAGNRNTAREQAMVGAASVGETKHKPLHKDYGPQPENLGDNPFGEAKPAVKLDVNELAQGIIRGEDGKPVSREQLEAWNKSDEELMKGYDK